MTDLTLTDDDRAAIDRACAAAIAHDYHKPPVGKPFDIAVIYRIIYLAGLRAGLKRAARICETMPCSHKSGPADDPLDKMHGPRDCAAAILAAMANRNEVQGLG